MWVCRRPLRVCRWLAAVLLGLTVAACGSGSSPGGRPTLLVGGIPDQDQTVLQERFGGMADYLSTKLGIPVEYRPSTSYSALVTAFGNGDVLLGWFGGLTGVQARLATDGAQPIAQRPRDERFHSVFIVHRDVQAGSLADLKGLSFTFGSESSTSGHLMPRFYLRQAGVEPERDFKGKPNYSGSHDKTWKLVEAGSFQAGALNETVWQEAVKAGEVDTSTVRVVDTTPAYYDYHWVAHNRIDELYGPGTVARIQQALLDMDAAASPAADRVLELFQTRQFIRTRQSNYDTIEKVARDLGLVRP